MSEDVQPRHRHTRHREEVDTLLQETTEFLSAQSVHAQLRDRGVRIGLTTVYRALQTLTQMGTIDAIRSSTGELVYRRCSPHRHHHLLCRTCARAVEVDGPALQKWADGIAVQHGYRDVQHSIEIFGICPSCSAKVEQDG